MKKNKVIFWVATLIIFLFEGVMPAFTSQTEVAREGIRHLGYPEYFGVMLAVFKVLGALVLVIPKIPKRIKEWAYAGFVFELIAACVSNWVVEGFGIKAVFPLIVMAILFVSYFFYHKIYYGHKRTVKDRF